MRTALQREQHCRATWCDRVRGKRRQMSDRIRLSVTTVQKTQNRKTLGGGGGGGAVLTPPTARRASCIRPTHGGATGGGRARGNGRGAKSEGAVPPAHVVSPLCGDKMTQCRHRRNTATLSADRTRISRACVPVRRSAPRRRTVHSALVAIPFRIVCIVDGLT